MIFFTISSTYVNHSFIHPLCVMTLQLVCNESPFGVKNSKFQSISRFYHIRLYDNHIHESFFIKLNNNLTWDKF